jgi:serine/threonine protein kinase
MSTFTSEPGTRLGGRYRLEDRLAAAGGWSAWKAIDEILARPVSVITFASGFPRLQQVVTAARAASRLTDTRLTQVFDVEDSWDHAYIVLEWPVGDTLADLLATGTLEPSAGARIVAETASAISGAHAAGLAHLCLQPEAVRWAGGGGVKVTGLGIDAALAGITADDPELTDTIALGSLLYAALTGLWPTPDHPDLAAAPMSDGRPRRPRQVRAGVPTQLDEIVSRVLGLGGRDDRPLTTPAELAAELAAVIPPIPIPPAAQARREPRRDQRYDQRRYETAGVRSAGGQTAPVGRPGPRRSLGRSVAVAALVLAAIVGLSAAALKLLHGPAPTHHATGGKPSSSPSGAGGQSTILAPASAHGFDALRTPTQDPSDENTSLAMNLIRHDPAGWATQQYYGSPYFGNLKSGSGLLIDMGKPVRITSVTIVFGSVPGANVELKEGDSSVRSAANESSMVTIARLNNASGQQTFTIAKPVADQYLVVWFTKLPPLQGAHGKFMAQIFSISIRGTD